MKALVIVVGMLFAGSVMAGERPAYLTPPTTSENVASKVLFGGFVAAAAASVVFGVVAMSHKYKGTTTANNLLTGSAACDGLAIGSLAGALVTF